MDPAILQLLNELGLKPVEVLILGMLCQNLRNTRVLLDKLIEKVQLMEAKRSIG